jgi:hypothetical protein
VRPASEVLDPQAQRHRAGKLAEIAGLLHQSDGWRHRRPDGCRVRRARIDRAWRKAAPDDGQDVREEPAPRLLRRCRHRRRIHRQQGRARVLG